MMKPEVLIDSVTAQAFEIPTDKPVRKRCSAEPGVALGYGSSSVSQ